jgi:polyisoprenyl-phosphate glycosyltransferase
VKKLISVVVPIYNEEESAPILLMELEKAIDGVDSYDFEFIFVDDGSMDQSVKVIKNLEHESSRLRLIEFARNFGKEAAVSAGIHEAKGDAVIIMDADLQHPPKHIPSFIKQWEDGAEVVVGVRKNDGKESKLKRWGSIWFYKIMQHISHTDITPHATDYRLIDRCVVNEFNRLTERNRMTRGLIDWLGFERRYFYFNTPERLHGEASYTMSKLIGLGLNSLTAYSLTPLRLAGYLGIVILFISAPLGFFVLVEQYIMGDPMRLQFTGSASLGIAVLFLVGIVLMCLGLVALYIAHIHTEVINRPLYVVRRKQEYEVAEGDN